MYVECNFGVRIIIRVYVDLFFIGRGAVLKALNESVSLRA